MTTVRIPEVEDLKIPALEKLIGTGPRPYSDEDVLTLQKYGGRVDSVESKLHSLGITRRE
jgi:hypothetical protein